MPFMLLAYVNAVPSSFCSQSFLELEARGMVATVFRMQVFHAAEALLVCFPRKWGLRPRGGSARGIDVSGSVEKLLGRAKLGA